MLPGCSWFVHTGLEFTIIGKRIICWECGEEFTADQSHLNEARRGDDMPQCGCTKGKLSSSEVVDFEEHIRRLTVQSKLKEIVSVPDEEDEVEVIEAEESHAADCMAPYGGDCTCK